MLPPKARASGPGIQIVSLTEFVSSHEPEIYDKVVRFRSQASLTTNRCHFKTKITKIQFNEMNTEDVLYKANPQCMNMTRLPRSVLIP